jgi:hypothetical protein
LAYRAVAGVYASPIIGFCYASKWVFEALHESLAQEVHGVGIWTDFW